ncbi:MAG: cation transporter [Chloroflexota bacterium]|nr:MAG: cation transporter [Chloroflexota bacterium]
MQQTQERHHDHHDHAHDHHQKNHMLGGLSNKLGIFGHHHDHRGLASDRAFRENQEGIRTIWVALGILLATALLQMVIVYFSRSVSLFADTAHNIGDGLNSIPLLIAFYLARRIPTRRYTYGFGRAEDVAGILIVLSIAVSAGVVFYQAIQRLLDPQPLTNLGWVAAAALIGFFGNEIVAILQIRVGRRIGSAAMVADGLHARTDGLTSLAVLLAAGGTWLGYPILDPVIGFLIGIAILMITWDAMKTIWYRLMDAVDPALIKKAEAVISMNDDVLEIRRIRMRWVGHCLHAEVYISVDPDLKTSQSHQIAEQVRHALFHEFPDLTDINVHVDPWSDLIESPHELTLGHEPVPTLIEKI